MVETIIISIFVLGYLAITLEHPLGINKAAAALITGTLSWTVYIVSSPEKSDILHKLEACLAEVSSVLFFLMGAMVIVELIDAHDGFQIITERITTKNKKNLLCILSVITFFLSAVLDNLTTTIVMVSLLKKLVPERNERLLFVGMTIIAANAGGAWSPIGDVTTTMLWIGGQVSASAIVYSLFIPSVVCMLMPLSLLSIKLRHAAPLVPTTPAVSDTSPALRVTILTAGLGVLILVPLFKVVTHLPPYMGMLFGLGIIWAFTEILHSGASQCEKGILSVNHALRKIDTPSILFFLGILLAVSALDAIGILDRVAHWLDVTVGNQAIIGLIIGLLSGIVDNVPLVAAAQGMYSLTDFPSDSFLWELLAYSTGTGGSSLIIGSAAGVAAMGLEKVDFFWYLKHISLLAVIGYLAGALVYLLLAMA